RGREGPGRSARGLRGENGRRAVRRPLGPGRTPLGGCAVRSARLAVLRVRASAPRSARGTGVRGGAGGQPDRVAHLPPLRGAGAGGAGQQWTGGRLCGLPPVVPGSFLLVAPGHSRSVSVRRCQITSRTCWLGVESQGVAMPRTSALTRWAGLSSGSLESPALTAAFSGKGPVSSRSAPC